ncbi:MAG: hypothetical protein FJX77_16750 [Armatimonadetes bacterium]|nr:hypothetical protein [Armatimonadota bacterium]
MLQNLLMDGIPEVRASLFAVLITSTAPFATDFIQETRQDSDPQLCRLVVEALLERPSPQGYSLLREELCHSDTARSAAAVQSLLRHPAEPHHALLQECLAAREPAELPGIFLPPEPADSRHIALQWLAACLSAPAQALLRQSLQHPDPTLRRLAVEALQEHPSRPGYVLLKERAPDKRGLFAGKPVLEPDRALRAAIGVAKEAIRIALEKTAGLPSAASATPITLDALPRIVPRAESEE